MLRPGGMSGEQSAGRKGNVCSEPGDVPTKILRYLQEFLQPIVTPYELEVALQPTQTWTGRYVLDFGQLLREHKEGLESKEAEPSSSVIC